MDAIHSVVVQLLRLIAYRRPAQVLAQTTIPHAPHQKWTLAHELLWWQEAGDVQERAHIVKVLFTRGHRSTTSYSANSFRKCFALRRRRCPDATCGPNEGPARREPKVSRRLSRDPLARSSERSPAPVEGPRQSGVDGIDRPLAARMPGAMVRARPSRQLPGHLPGMGRSCSPPTGASAKTRLPNVRHRIRTKVPRIQQHRMVIFIRWVPLIVRRIRLGSEFARRENNVAVEMGVERRLTSISLT